MSDRLTDEQLGKLVAEASRLSQRDDLDTEQVNQVLADLNLSPDLLDDAKVQLQRREALAVQQRRIRWMSIGVAVAVIGSITWVGLNRWQYQTLVNQVGVVQDRVTLFKDDGGRVQQVNRHDNPELYYRVTLSDAPVNRHLSLSCQWETPDGDVIRENRYQTRRINTPVWNTYCRYQIGSESPEGTWTVEMFLGDRAISDARFEVQ